MHGYIHLLYLRLKKHYTFDETKLQHDFNNNILSNNWKYCNGINRTIQRGYRGQIG